jgi:hypothetical protein
LHIDLLETNTEPVPLNKQEKSHSLMAQRTEISLFSETNYNIYFFQRKIGEFLLFFEIGLRNFPFYGKN